MSKTIRIKPRIGRSSSGKLRPPKSQHAKASPAEILTLTETAKLLRISRPTLLELVHRKEIPARQVGRQWRFHRGAVLEWLQGNRRGSR